MHFFLLLPFLIQSGFCHHQSSGLTFLKITCDSDSTLLNTTVSSYITIIAFDIIDHFFSFKHFYLFRFQATTLVSFLLGPFCLSLCCCVLSMSLTYTCWRESGLRLWTFLSTFHSSWYLVSSLSYLLLLTTYHLVLWLQILCICWWPQSYIYILNFPMNSRPIYLVAHAYISLDV